MEPNTPHSLPSTHEPKKTGIIYSIPALLAAIATVGPLAIPLVWKNPRFNSITKTFISVAIILLTGWLLKFGVKLVEDLTLQINSLTAQ